MLTAASAAAAQLKRCALRRGTIGNSGVAAAHLNLVERAVVLVAAVVAAAGYGTFDAGIDIPTHGEIPPLLI